MKNAAEKAVDRLLRYARKPAKRLGVKLSTAPKVSFEQVRDDAMWVRDNLKNFDPKDWTRQPRSVAAIACLEWARKNPEGWKHTLRRLDKTT